MEQTLEVPQSPLSSGVKVEEEEIKPRKTSRKPKTVTHVLSDVEETNEKRRRKRKVRDPDAPKRVPNKWQTFIKEKCMGKKFGSQKESQNHMKLCASEYRKLCEVKE